MTRTPNFHSIPIGLIHIVFSENLVKDLQAYLLLTQLDKSGKFKLDNKLIEAFRIHLGCKCDKTVKNRIRRLEKRNWIWYNNTNEFYQRKGVKTVFEQEKVRFLSLTIHINTNPKNKVKVDKSAVGKYLSLKTDLFVCFLLHIYKRTLIHKDNSENLATKKDVAGSGSSSFLVAIRYLQKALGCSIGTIERLKQQAIDNGMLSVIQRFQSCIHKWKDGKLYREYFNGKNTFYFLESTKCGDVLNTGDYGHPVFSKVSSQIFIRLQSRWVINERML